MNRKKLQEVVLEGVRADMGLDKPKKKIRKARKPMSEEQRKAAGERLAKARAKRMAENPPEYKSIHASVLERADDDPWSLANVRRWIKTQKELLSSERKNMRNNVKGSIAKVAEHEGYIRNLQTYIKTGTYIDMFWGEYQQNKVGQKCIVMAYHPDGTPKRCNGVFYPDIGMTWDSTTMDEKDYTPEKEDSPE